MNNKSVSIYIVVFALLFVFSCAHDTQETDKDFSAIKGPYLGQKPPGMTPELFAPGLITTHYSQSYSAFLHEARVCVYSASTEKGHETFYTYEKSGRWTAPQRAPFEELQGHPNYTAGPLGRKVYFHSGRPTHPDDTREDDNIWTIEWTGSDWAEPEALPPPANSDYGEAYPSASSDGTVYFFTWRRPGTRGYDIWVSRSIDGQYQEAERLPWPINSDFSELDPYVAPDGSFLIFSSSRPGGYGNSDNYVCFRKEDGNWTPPINLGRPYNSSSYDLCANGTPDGKYFFFTSGRKTDVDKGLIGKEYREESEEDSDLYWADFSFIDDLKNTLLTKQNAADIIEQDYEENGVEAAVDSLNRLYSNQKDRHFFLPFALLSLCEDMITDKKTGDADLFVSALYDVLPKDLMIKEGYAHLCAMNRCVSKGMKILEELESENPNFDLSDSLSNLGYLFTLYPDKIKDALSVLKFTVEKFPQDWFAYYSLARIHRQLGDLDKAITNCRKALEISPSVGDVSQLLERLINEQEEKKSDRQNKESFPVLRGPYLGQKPPGLTPELFAPDIVPTEDNEHLYGFFRNGTLFLFDRTPADLEEWTPGVYRMELTEGKWTPPNASPYLGKPWYHSYPEAPEGEQEYFAWKGSLGDRTSSPDVNIWRVRKTAEGWTEPHKLPSPVNSPDLDTYPSVTDDGTLYFFSDREGGLGGHDIYRSPQINGQHLTVENLGAPTNTEYDELDPFIAPDESYLIFCSKTRDGYGGFDLYITFKKTDGTWTNPVNMGKGINTPAYDWVPYVTPDGRYFFFNSTRTGSWDIFWVDSSVIKALRPEEIE